MFHLKRGMRGGDLIKNNDNKIRRNGDKDNSVVWPEYRRERKSIKEAIPKLLYKSRKRHRINVNTSHNLHSS